MAPLVSVVIPVFNGMPYLPEAVASVEAQEYPEIELVLVDGGSTDGSAEWIAAYEGPRVIKDTVPPGSGAAANWNRCTQLATGTYVKLLCQDDVLYPGALATQVQALEGHPTARVAFAQRDIVSAAGAALARNRGCQGLADGPVGGREALRACYVRGTNIFGEPLCALFERDAMVQALPWQDDDPFVLDILFYANVLARHDAVIMRTSIGAFRVSGASWSTRLANEQKRQFRTWQQHARAVIGPTTRWEDVRAAIATQRETQVRRLAYLVLRASGRMR